ncbi:hypothetical protein KP509_01G004800 [Ceratopteris richardii]|uniref:Uncharacterized protein n=1 Tax=Ceratopteris richardii TaxID=49495 RepID=A0A8T2VE54_CERRI|nr:hypothetical protein KP509_01G004800 [Ceratopteris richardii]
MASLANPPPPPKKKGERICLSFELSLPPVPRLTLAPSPPHCPSATSQHNPSISTQPLLHLHPTAPPFTAVATPPTIATLPTIHLSSLDCCTLGLQTPSLTVVRMLARPAHIPTPTSPLSPLSFHPCPCLPPSATLPHSHSTHSPSTPPPPASLDISPPCATPSPITSSPRASSSAQGPSSM